MALGDRIREARKKKGYTQRQLADLIQAKHNSISNWENNQNKPGPDTIELLCGILNVSPTWLLSGVNDGISHSQVDKDKLINFNTFIHNYLNYKSMYNTDSPSVDIILKKEPDKIYNVPIEIYDDFMDEIPEYIHNEFMKMLKYSKVIEDKYQIKEDYPEHLQVMAAHNDFAEDEEEQKLMQEDIDEL